ADNLERALQHGETEPGLELTLKSFQAALARHGVEPMTAEGEPFDPALHEAIHVIVQPDMEPGTVAAVETAGYTLNGKLLRPSQVIVVAA
ncbi:MAG: nucleotide exchange factor GrpE, partial [Chloroflexi bacterium]|nr:nucleotide exchange factor GrpE [Chloroflexota bacterium]